MSNQRTLAVARHAVTPHNTMIDGEGSEALTAMLSKAVQEGASETDLALLLRQILVRDREAEAQTSISLHAGQQQCSAAKTVLRHQGLTFSACLHSPYLRAKQTANAIVDRHSVPFFPCEALCERDLGVFHHLPRALFHRFFPLEAAEKARNPLGWKPLDGYSLYELWPALRSVIFDATNIIRSGGNVLLVAHADVNVALRALPELGGMSTDQLLSSGPGGINPLWFQNCQMDLYSFGDPRGIAPWYLPTHFRSVAPCGTTFDTGWHEIER